MRNILPLLIGVIVAGIVTFFVFDTLMTRLATQGENTAKSAEERAQEQARTVATQIINEQLDAKFAQFQETLRQERQEERNAINNQMQALRSESYQQVLTLQQNTQTALNQVVSELRERPVTPPQVVTELERTVRIVAFSQELPAGTRLTAADHLKVLERPSGAVSQGAVMVPPGQPVQDYVRRFDGRYLKLDVLEDQPMTFNLTQTEDPSPANQQMQAVLQGVMTTTVSEAPPPEQGTDPGAAEQLQRQMDQELLSLAPKPPEQRLETALFTPGEVARALMTGANVVDIYRYEPFGKIGDDEAFLLEPVIRSVRVHRKQTVETDEEGNSKINLLFYADVGEEMAARIALARGTLGIRIVPRGADPIYSYETVYGLSNGRRVVPLTEDQRYVAEGIPVAPVSVDEGEDAYLRDLERQREDLRRRQQQEIARIQAEARQNAAATSGTPASARTLQLSTNAGIASPTGQRQAALPDAGDTGGVSVTPLSLVQDPAPSAAAPAPQQRSAQGADPQLTPVDSLDSLLSQEAPATTALAPAEAPAQATSQTATAATQAEPEVLTLEDLLAPEE